MRRNKYLEGTLRSCERAFPYFSHVSIYQVRIEEVAAENALKDFELPRWDFSGTGPGSNIAFPSHCFWWSVLNFCFARHSDRDKGKLIRFEVEDLNGKMRRGALALQACFYRFWKEKPIVAEDVLRLFGKNYGHFIEFFKGKTELPLLEERWRFVLEAAKTLRQRFDGDPMNILEEGNFRAFGDEKNSGIVDILVKYFNCFGQDFFRDAEGIFGPEKLSFSFYKRAQLFVLMYHGRACGSDGKLRPIRDIELLGPIPDYGLPRSYDSDGIFVYGNGLRKCVDEATPILRHSKMELEIRLATVWSQIFELELMNRLRAEKGLAPLHVGHIDYWRWSRARGKPNNHHLCYTTDY